MEKSKFNQKKRERLPIDTSGINFSEIKPDLFNEVAKSIATSLKPDDKKYNKPTQLRKFYDEILMWNQKTKAKKEDFYKHLPFIMMINAKAAYSKGRDLINEDFLKVIEKCLEQLKSAEDLETCKLFLEAVMGFYKELRPKDN